MDTDADVAKFVSDFGKRLEKLGKTQLASKKVLSLLSGLMEESVKLGVLRIDEVGELKRLATVRHNDLNAKVKKGDKKKPAAQAAKPVVALARNAFMVSTRTRQCTPNYRTHAGDAWRCRQLTLTARNCS